MTGQPRIVYALHSRVRLAPAEPHPIRADVRRCGGTCGADSIGEERR
jgi:hypothetical protein